MTTTPTTDGGAENNDALDVATTHAYLAVGLLDSAIGPESYNQRDVREALDNLRDARESAPEGTDTAEAIDTALAYLTGLERLELDERRVKVRDALAELAPVAAGVADRDTVDEKPTVTVLFNVPREAADRAIERFEQYREDAPAPDHRVYLTDYIYDEIDRQNIIYVDGEPFAEYASAAGVESLVIDPDDYDE